ncbi:hypothetical protein MAUB1S_08910 [Mycolicibacterium aubagnense]
MNSDSRAAYTLPAVGPPAFPFFSETLWEGVAS